MGTAIRLEHVTHRYGRGASTSVTAIDDANLEIGAGDFAVVMGPSGSGKSTLLHLIGAIDRPVSGRLFHGDLEVSALGEGELTMIRRTTIGFVFQFFNLIPTLTVRENVELPLRLAGMSRPAASSRVDEVIRRVGLDRRECHYPRELSGGEMQRTAIGRAIVHGPAILLADEPTGNLDSHAGDRVLDLVREIHEEEGPTVVMATHSIRAAAYGQYRINIVDGRLDGGEDTERRR